MTTKYGIGQKAFYLDSRKEIHEINITSIYIKNGGIDYYINPNVNGRVTIDEEELFETRNDCIRGKIKLLQEEIDYLKGCIH